MCEVHPPRCWVAKLGQIKTDYVISCNEATNQRHMSLGHSVQSKRQKLK
jgi:hypothetical protein